MLLRILTTLVLATGILVTGVPASVAAAPLPVPVEVRSADLDGLPTAAAFAQRGHEVVSEPVQAPLAFSLVGFRVPPGAAVAFRTSEDGAAWTPWTEVVTDADEGPDRVSPERGRGPTGRLGSEPVWVGQARWLQTRVTGATPEDVGAALVDSAGLWRSWPRRVADHVRAALVAPAARAVVDRPAVVTREQWGAEETPETRSVAYARRVRFGVVHHTAGSNDYAPADGAAIVRGIQRYHMRSQRWDDIGYHFLVDRYGTIYEGRAGGMERPVIGAHAGGFNTGSFGVALMGSFDASRPTEAALDALVDLLTWKFDVHHLDVAGAVEVTSRGSSRWPEGQRLRLATLSSHRDVSSTGCPGDALYAELGRIRHRMLERAGDVLLDHAAAPPEVVVVNGAPTQSPLRFTTRLRPAGAWAFEVRDPSGAVVHTAAGTGELAAVEWTPRLVVTGRYSYTFASPQRRSATDYVDMLPPVIRDAVAAPASVAFARNGNLAAPVGFRARLWPGASWTVAVRDPGGTVVFAERGDGERLAATWRGPATTRGRYTWQMTAAGAEPAGGGLDVYAELLTRVGTPPDPIAAAVEVSRAAFPLPRAAPRAVLARADVFADAMTGGPLAGRDGPVLLTSSAALDARVAAELDRVLAPNAVVYLLGGGSAVSEGVRAELERRWRVVRLAGPERTATAAAVAREVVARTGARTALVARAGPDDALPWADALAGGAYGAASGIPVLLTHPAQLSPATAAALRDLRTGATVVLGGPNAVGDAVIAALPHPRRVFGADRAATAVAVARELWGRVAGRDGDAFVLASARRPDAWAYALAATPLAARGGAPLLVADADALPVATRDYLAGLDYGAAAAGTGWIVGGEHLVGRGAVDAANRLLQ